MLILIGWNLFALVYVVLTVRAFSRVDRSEFVSRMAARESPAPAVWRRINARGDRPTYAVESTLVSFAVVLVLPRVPGIRIHDWILIPLTLSILLSCWAVSIVAYALHYAQKDIAEPSLDFPGQWLAGTALPIGVLILALLLAGIGLITPAAGRALLAAHQRRGGHPLRAAPSLGAPHRIPAMSRK